MAHGNNNKHSYKPSLMKGRELKRINNKGNRWKRYTAVQYGLRPEEPREETEFLPGVSGYNSRAKSSESYSRAKSSESYSSACVVEN